MHAVYAKTGLITYHGPHFSTFGFETEREYTYEGFRDCTMTAAPYSLTPSMAAGAYVSIQSGAMYFLLPPFLWADGAGWNAAAMV